MSAVTIDVEQLIRRLRIPEDRVRNLSAINKRGAQMLRLLVEDAFDTQGRSTVGGKWEDLEEETKKKRRRGPPFMILQDSSDLVQSVAEGSGADFFEVQTKKPYARFHLEGTEHMPARDFLDVKLDEVVDDYADELLAELSR